jgi:hypothetical protein
MRRSVSRSALVTSMSPSRMRAAHARRRRQQPADRERGHALARAGLADDAEHLVRMHLEVDAAHRRHRTPGPDEGDLEITDGEDGGCHACSPLLFARQRE